MHHSFPNQVAHTSLHLHDPANHRTISHQSLLIDTSSQLWQVPSDLEQVWQSRRAFASAPLSEAVGPSRHRHCMSHVMRATSELSLRSTIGQYLQQSYQRTWLDCFELPQ